MGSAEPGIRDIADMRTLTQPACFRRSLNQYQTGPRLESNSQDIYTSSHVFAAFQDEPFFDVLRLELFRHPRFPWSRVARRSPKAYQENR